MRLTKPMTEDVQFDDLLDRVLSGSDSDADRYELVDRIAQLARLERGAEEAEIDANYERGVAQEVGAKVVLERLISLCREWPSAIPTNEVARLILGVEGDTVSEKFYQRCDEYACEHRKDFEVKCPVP